MSREAARGRLVDRLVETGRIDDGRVADALRAVPRHEFVPESVRGQAYRDRPLSIGEGQTVSAPHMVAVMCDLLDLDRGERVLEIGTGCGYHAAVTAELVGPGNVYSVEYHDALAEQAHDRLDRLEYDVHVQAGDGREGWPEHAPFDACYLTCAAREVPDALFEQVRDCGRLLAPVGDQRQTLYLFDHDGDGWTRTDHGGVRFVPLLG
ncbi:protein-L-isoaspartate O-methyltransferase [Halorarius halobius]|uniref:protein-L-isoaspartate O-methyltransferase n=1 Tax=Halorarius halobius TaxID=2962671 RepID=UPI0020CC6ED4|nr:protein-L-isoaspartate O-methyltransferase [Halorarius halobius]